MNKILFYDGVGLPPLQVQLGAPRCKKRGNFLAFVLMLHVFTRFQSFVILIQFLVFISDDLKPFFMRKINDFITHDKLSSNRFKDISLFSQSAFIEMDPGIGCEVKSFLSQLQPIIRPLLSISSLLPR